MSNLQLDALLVTKEQLLCQLECFCTAVDECSSVASIEARLESASNLLTRFLRVAFEIKSLSPESFDDAEVKMFEKKYFDVISKAKSMLAGSSNSTSQNGKSNSTVNISACNLKKPEMPKFSGLPEDWPSFYQMFLSLVHNNTEVSSVVKFVHLRKSLDKADKAFDLIGHLDLNEENYLGALDLLNHRYNNKRLLINQQIANLLNLGFSCSCKTKDFRMTTKSVEQIINRLNQALQSLTSLGVDTSSWDPIIANVAISKFDTYTLAEWEKTCSQRKTPTRKEVFDFLEKRLRVVESLERQGTLSKSNRMDRKRSPPRSSKSTSYGFMQTNNKKRKLNDDKSDSFKPKSLCKHCNGHHTLQSCAIFKKLTLPDRILVVRSYNLCEQCLKLHKGDCRADPCSQCRGKHNFLLHRPAKNQTVSKNDNSQDKNASENASNDPNI